MGTSEWCTTAKPALHGAGGNHPARSPICVRMRTQVGSEEGTVTATTNAMAGLAATKGEPAPRRSADNSAKRCHRRVSDHHLALVHLPPTFFHLPFTPAGPLRSLFFFSQAAFFSALVFLFFVGCSPSDEPSEALRRLESLED